MLSRQVRHVLRVVEATTSKTFCTVRGLHAGTSSGRRWMEYSTRGAPATADAEQLTSIFTEDERRAFVVGVCEAVIAYEHTHDDRYLRQLARQVRTTLELHSSERYRRQLHHAPRRAASDQAVEASEVLAKLV